jgi:hypothetical protein
MQRRSNRTRMPARQPDLFDTSPGPVVGTMPSWGSLPQKTRRTLTGLMTRLLVDHANGGPSEPRSDADEL